MAKGIIIDVGFESDIKDFISEIERQFKDIDFDSALNLSDAFKEQSKDVRKQLSELKDEIDAALSGTTKNDLNKQVQTLNKAVGVLTSSFKEMIKVMPTSQASKFTSELDGITSEIKELSDVCDNAANAVKKVSDVADGNIKFINTDQIKKLEELYKTFGKIEKAAEKVNIGQNKSGKISYKDDEETLRDIIKYYEQYLKIQDKIEDVKFDESLGSSEKTSRLDDLNKQYAQLSITLQRLFNTYEKLGGDLKDTFKPYSDMPDFKISLDSARQSLKDEFNDLLSYIATRKAEIQSEVYSLGGGDLNTLIGDADSALKKNKITIPIGISTKESTLLNDALSVISGVQSKISSNPLEVEVVLVSNTKYKTKKNSEIFEQIAGSLDNISDEEVKGKLTNLINNLNSQFKNDLHINIEVEGSKKVQAEVETLLTTLREELEEAVTVYPDIRLTEDAKAKLQSDINKLSEGVTVNIGIKDEAGEAAGASSTKRELKNITELRNCLETIITSIENKTAAFQVEEQTVTGVVAREISSLQELDGWLLELKGTIDQISNLIVSMPDFKIEFDKESLEKLKDLNDEGFFNKSKNNKNSFGSSIKIPKEQKDKLLKDINDLSSQVSAIFETDSIDNWTSKFLSSLTEISNKIKSLFGNNALSDMIEQWTSSDELMKKVRGNAHLRERAAVIDDKGNIYGSGTYDQHGSTAFWSYIVDELKDKGLFPKIAIHSHSSDRIAASSLPQFDKNGNMSGDLIARYVKYFQEGIEKELTIALNDIELFDSKGFYTSNSGIDFSSEDIGKRIANKTNELYKNLKKQFYQYFDQFVSQYGTVDADVFKNEIFSYNNDDILINRIKDKINPQELLDNFFNGTKYNNYSSKGTYSGDFGKILYNAISNSFDMSSIDTSDLGYSKEELNSIYKEFLQQVYDNAIKILNNAFDISNFSYDRYNGGKLDGDYRDYWTFAFRQMTPQILEEALAGTGYKNNYQDFMKVYSKEDFIKQNPLGLSSDSLSSLFDVSAPTEFLGTLDKIVADLTEIKNSSDVISSAFNIKIDENSLKSFIDEINKLIDRLEQLPSTLTESLSGINTMGRVVGEITGNEIKDLDPIKNLGTSFNNYKKFYDNNDLESEAGAKAALSYYNAYKEALASKVNKKDLQQYTIGKTDDLFTGNYTNYKKGIGDLDLSGLNSEIVRYQEIIDKFNQPETISIINSLTEAIEKLLTAGTGNEQTTKLLESLNKVINNLGNSKGADKITRVAENLVNFQKSIQVLDISDSGFIQSLNSILEKGEELKALGEVLKSTQKQINAAGKAVKAEENLNKAQEYLEKYENDIREAVNQDRAGKNESVLYQQLQATKDGLVQIIALIKDADDKYKKFIYTTTDGSDLKIKSTAYDDDPAVEKLKRQYEAYKRLKDLTIPGAKNLGEEGVTFTPDSDNWDQLIDKVKEFGIEAENIVKILRNVDREGYESFQIFTDLSRITVGMDSKGVLFQWDNVFDKNAINDFKKEILSLQKLLKNAFSGNDLNTKVFLDALDSISDKWKELSHLNENNPELIDDKTLQNLQDYFNIFKTTISSISLDKISTEKRPEGFINQLREAENQLNLVKIALDKVESGEAFTDEDINNIKIFISQMRELQSATKDKGNKLADPGSINKVLEKIYKNLDKNSVMSSDLKNRFKELAAEMKSFGDNMPYDKFKEFSNRYQQLEREMWETGQVGDSFFNGIIKRAKSMSQSFISMYLSLWDIIRYVRTGVTYIKDLDTALTEMRKVSDESTESLKNFQKVSFDIASTVGTTAKQIQNSTADWMRLGESLDEAAESAKVSNVLFNVSEFESIDEATESLVAMSAAYDDLDKMNIVDKLNEIGNNYAISTDGLATALQNSASALKTAGNDMDEAVALVTAGNQVVQDPSKVGSGLRTIALRITGTEEAKAELEELGEDTSDFIVQTASKSQEAIKNFTKVASNDFKGFDILDENGNYKSTYDILLGISEIYEEILETDKKYGSNMANGLLETLAGKNRSNIAASILQNPDILKQAYESSQNAEGSALEENEKYLDSIEGKIQQFTNEVQEFWYNLISSDIIKWIIDAGTQIVDLLGKIVGALGEAGTAATVFAGALGIKSIAKNGGGRVKKFALKVIKYATESFSREVCEF